MTVLTLFTLKIISSGSNQTLVYHGRGGKTNKKKNLSFVSEGVHQREVCGFAHFLQFCVCFEVKNQLLETVVVTWKG